MRRNPAASMREPITADISREVMVTQDELAAMANLSRATINTILRRFAKQAINRVAISVNNCCRNQSLRKLANDE
jgi:hypothetical protein